MCEIDSVDYNSYGATVVQIDSVSRVPICKPVFFALDVYELLIRHIVNGTEWNL